MSRRQRRNLALAKIVAYVVLAIVALAYVLIAAAMTPDQDTFLAFIILGGIVMWLIGIAIAEVEVVDDKPRKRKKPTVQREVDPRMGVTLPLTPVHRDEIGLTATENLTQPYPLPLHKDATFEKEA